MNIREELQHIVRSAIAQTGITYQGEIPLNYPDQMSMGDFASPIALKLAKELERNPRELAEQIVTNITTESLSLIEGVEVAGPGFVNFTLSPSFWAKLKQTVLQEKNLWGSNQALTEQRYLVEHSSPNMFKPFHLGHLVNNFVGASINRIIEQSGATTHTVTFPSDISPGIAKAVWGLNKLNKATGFSIEDVGEAYAHGSAQYKEDEVIKQEINEINKTLYEQTPGQWWDIYQEGLALSMSYFKEITSRLGTSFDAYFPESECEQVGKEIVAEYIGTVFKQSEGAIIFEGSQYGMFDNVFINSQGFGTYLCKDLGLLKKKFDAYNFDCSLTVTDIEQKQHFELLKKAAELIKPEWSDKSVYIHHGRLSLTSGKISSRGGGAPLALDLLEAVKKRVLEKMANRPIAEQNKDDIAEQVAQGALRFAIVRVATGKNIVFDFDKDLSFEGSSAPYIQYSYVRAQSALRDVRELLTGQEQSERTGETPELERRLVRFDEVVTRALEDYSPHHIAQYVYELASEFNSFYVQTKIADAHNPDLLANIELVEAVAQTLHNGLYLLGIETVEEM